MVAPRSTPDTCCLKCTRGRLDARDTDMLSACPCCLAFCPPSPCHLSHSAPPIGPDLLCDADPHIMLFYIWRVVMDYFEIISKYFPRWGSRCRVFASVSVKNRQKITQTISKTCGWAYCWRKCVNHSLHKGDNRCPLCKPCEWITVNVFIVNIGTLGFTKGTKPLWAIWAHPKHIPCLYRIPTLI